ncbi:MAG: recombinase family protein [Bdellovibrionales bacterium]|nr:recombinase family protein [Bdellovibrionales bacterium]
MRVSTDQQSSGLMAQERALREYCEQNGIKNFVIFKDENQSGAKTSRPALDQMMKSVRSNQISMVVVFAFSRFARSTTHLLTALEEFKKHRTEFVSITEKSETNSPMGLALLTILGALSQMERELISQRVQAGLRNARAKGKKIGRQKTRPSEVIRALLKQGMKYREIAKIAGCSHGCISAQKREIRKEEALRAEKEQEVQKLIKPNLTIV